MTEPSALLYGTYDRESCGGLCCIATDQRLLIHKVQSSKLHCEYKDSEISVKFTVQLPKNGHRYGKAAVVDWNRGPSQLLRSNYGAWRRVTWFLLDAILVWLVEAEQLEQTVLLLGGWFNGRWLSKGRFRSSCSDFGQGKSWLKEEVRTFRPYPLDSKAPSWRYKPGLDGAREGRIACLDGEENTLPIADTFVPVADQLSQVPRFIADDGTILFFHRVVPHVGPEYSPAMKYGLATTDYAFYFSAMHGSVASKPIRLKAQVELTQPFLVEERQRLTTLPENFQPLPDSWRLHPALREQQYFAGAEAYAMSFDMQNGEFPEMRSIEHNQPMRFGYNLGEISDPPISVGMPSTQIRSWPRLSGEPDERVTGFVARIREAQRARRQREHMNFRIRLLRGEVPQHELDDLLARYAKKQQDQ